MLATIDLRLSVSYFNYEIVEKVADRMTERLNALDEKEMALYYAILPTINACL